MKLMIRKCLTVLIHRVRNYRYRIQGYNISKSTRMERGLNLDRLNPKGIHIGERSIVTSNVTILSHRNIVPIKKENQWIWENTDTYIGDDCVIGIGVIILAGVRIGDEVVVAAGSVVTRNVPSKSIAAGNPAKIIKRDIDIHNILL